MMLKTVTLQEANGLLPLVREHFWRLHILLAHLQHLKNSRSKVHSYRLNKKSDLIEIVKKTRRASKNSLKLAELGEIEALIELEINQLMRLGAVVKGLFPPHIDFLSMKNNEPIFLCWHGGENEINHWHQLDDGSPVRHTIIKDSFGPHVVH